MSQMIKSSTGLLYTEENWNDISLLWDISPNNFDRVVIKDDSIALLPGERIELLINAPKDSGYVMQTQLEYNPVTENERAGCVLKSVTDNAIELEIKGDNSEKYNYSKLIVDDNSILTAKASIDGITWIDYGNTKLINMNKLGFYIDSGETCENSITIKKFILYKSNYIFFNNIEYNCKIRLFDYEDNEITNGFVIKKRKNQICIDGTNFIFPLKYMKIKIYDKQTDEIISEDILTDIYGGDVYDYKYDVDFYINDNLLDNNVYNLGNLRRENNYMLTIVNKENFDILNKKLFVTYYSIYNPGYKLVKISPENEGDFLDELSIDLLAGETKKINLKIRRDDNINNVDEKYMFNIVFE